jgi:hypothetical protein
VSDKERDSDHNAEDKKNRKRTTGRNKAEIARVYKVSLRLGYTYIGYPRNKRTETKTQTIKTNKQGERIGKA